MLIECSECGGQVSDRAAACPKCGNPIRPLSARLRAASAPLAMPVVVACVLGALVFTSLLLPLRWEIPESWKMDGASSDRSIYGEPYVQWEWLWDRPTEFQIEQARAKGQGVYLEHHRVSWEVLLLEQGTILVVGGVLIAWFVRRRRRAQVA